ncbi:hypothetical protein X975_07014, partial [Stegodyphus mimosarum]
MFRKVRIILLFASLNWLFCRLHIKMPESFSFTEKTLYKKIYFEIEQSYDIKFCYKLGKCTNETLKIIQTIYGEASLSRKQVYEWYNSFKRGRKSFEDEINDRTPTNFKKS